MGERGNNNATLTNQEKQVLDQIYFSLVTEKLSQFGHYRRIINDDSSVNKTMFPTQPNKNYTCHELCLVPRRLSLDENVRAKEGGKETTGETSFRLPSVPFPWSLAIHNQSLAITLRQTKRLRRRLPRAVFSFSLPFF